MTIWLPIGGYLLGSIPFAFLMARRLGGVDVRAAGSGNVGAANVLRTTRVSVAIAVVALDLAKGSAAVWLAGELGAGVAARAVTGVAAVIGHVYPIWLRFRGGKGVAVAAGVFGVLAPPATAIAVAIFVTTVWATRYVSLGSIIAALALPPLVGSVGATSDSEPLVYAAAAAAALILFRHRGNLRRLLNRTERRLGEAG
jgi:glycerol-3-phosphate acyltransferase PlsY